METLRSLITLGSSGRSPGTGGSLASHPTPNQGSPFSLAEGVPAETLPTELTELGEGVEALVALPGVSADDLMSLPDVTSLLGLVPAAEVTELPRELVEALPLELAPTLPDVAIQTSAEAPLESSAPLTNNPSLSLPGATSAEVAPTVSAAAAPGVTEPTLARPTPEATPIESALAGLVKEGTIELPDELALDPKLASERLSALRATTVPAAKLEGLGTTDAPTSTSTSGGESQVIEPTLVPPVESSGESGASSSYLMGGEGGEATPTPGLEAVANVTESTVSSGPEVPVASEVEVAPLDPSKATNPTKLASKSATAPLPTPESSVFTPELGAKVLGRIRVTLQPELREATIQLTPAELGRVQIRIAMHDGVMAASFRTETAQAREVLERQLPELRAMLAAQGIEAERIDVDLESNGFDHRDTNAHTGDQPREGRREKSSRSFDLSIAANVALESLTQSQGLRDTSGIDTLA